MAKVDLGRVSVLLESGVSSNITTQPQKYSSLDIDFKTSFTKIPLVLLTIVSNSESYRYGSLQYAISNRSKTGFTIRVFNNSDIQLSPMFNWCAMEEVE